MTLRPQTPHHWSCRSRSKEHLRAFDGPMVRGHATRCPCPSAWAAPSSAAWTASSSSAAAEVEGQGLAVSARSLRQFRRCPLGRPALQMIEVGSVSKVIQVTSSSRPRMMMHWTSRLSLSARHMAPGRPALLRLRPLGRCARGWRSSPARSWPRLAEPGRPCALCAPGAATPRWWPPALRSVPRPRRLWQETSRAWRGRGTPMLAGRYQ